MSAFHAIPAISAAKRRGLFSFAATEFWVAADSTTEVVSSKTRATVCAGRINGYTLTNNGSGTGPEMQTRNGWLAWMPTGSDRWWNTTTAAVYNASDSRAVFTLVFRWYGNSVNNSIPMYVWSNNTTVRHEVRMRTDTNFARITRAAAQTNIAGTYSPTGTYTTGVTYDGTNVLVYRNGVLSGSAANTTSVSTDTDRFWVYPSGTTAPLQGAVLLVAGTALDATQHAEAHTVLSGLCP